MRRLNVFCFTTLNGYYKGPGEDISWNQHDSENNEHAENGLQGNNILLFGRITYEMMAGFWPSPQAAQMMPEIAKGMNEAEKIVFSNTLQSPAWKNTRAVSGDIVKAVRELKQTPGKDLTILGSGSIVTLFSDHGLIDAWQIMLNPVLIGEGTTLFSGLQKQLNLQLVKAKPLSNGSLVLDYIPV